MIWIFATLVICFGQFPLLRDFDYDFSFTFCILATLLLPPIWIYQKRPMKTKEWGVLLLAPFLMPLACDYIYGVGWYLLLGVTQIFILYSITKWITFTFPRPKRSYQVYALLLLGCIVAVFSYLYFSPMVAFFHPVIGYFQGPIYDSHVPFSYSLLLQRGVHMAIAILILILTHWPKISIKGVRQGGIVLLLLPLVLGNWVLFSTSYDNLKEYMDAPLKDESPKGKSLCQVYSSPGLFTKKVRHRLQRECEFIVDFQKNKLQIDPAPFSLFFYKNRKEKKKWMGAGRTQIADVFNRSIHMVYHSPFDSTLSHEIAHILSVDFAPWYKFPLKIALLEGLPMAVQFKEDSFSLHQGVKTLKILKRAPSMNHMMSLLFWTESGSRSYTFAGSIVRFLIDEFGAEKFKKLYQGGNFKEVYNLPFSEVVNKWEKLIDQISISPEILAMARTRFSLKGAFGRNCLRKGARLEFAYANRNNYEEKMEILDQLCDNSPTNLWLFYRKTKLMRQFKKVDKAKKEIKSILDLNWKNSPIESWVQIRLLEDLADLSSKDIAAPIYQQLVKLQLSSSFQRRIYIKDFALRLNKKWMLEYVKKGGVIPPIHDSIEAEYLHARKLFNLGKYLTSALKLEEITNLKEFSQLPRALREEVYHLWGRSYFYGEDLKRSREVFQKGIEHPDLQPPNAQFKLWVERCKYLMLKGDMR